MPGLGVRSRTPSRSPAARRSPSCTTASARPCATRVAEHLGAHVVVCCHGGVVNAVLRMALRAPATGDFELFTTNASLTELLLVRPGRWRLVRYNDAAHLAGL